MGEEDNARAYRIRTCMCMCAHIDARIRHAFKRQTNINSIDDDTLAAINRPVSGGSIASFGGSSLSGSLEWMVSASRVLNVVYYRYICIVVGRYTCMVVAGTHALLLQVHMHSCCRYKCMDVVLA